MMKSRQVWIFLLISISTFIAGESLLSFFDELTHSCTHNSGKSHIVINTQRQTGRRLAMLDRQLNIFILIIE